MGINAFVDALENATVHVHVGAFCRCTRICRCARTLDVSAHVIVDVPVDAPVDVPVHVFVDVIEHALVQYVSVGVPVSL